MIAEIENAICARLESASRLGVLGYRLKTVETYGGQLDDADTLNRLLPKLPACLVTFVRESGRGEYTNGAYRFEGHFAVIVVTRNARNEAASRHGVEGEIGSYQIRRDVRVLLSDQRLGLGQGRLVPEGTTSLFSGLVGNKKLSVISVEFGMTYTDACLADDSLPAELPAKAVEEARRIASEAGREFGPAELTPAVPLTSVGATWLARCGYEGGQAVTNVPLEGTR